jgi:hypothetical protein
MRHVAEKTQTPIEKLYETIGWPLNKKYGHSLDAFKISITYVVRCTAHSLGTLAYPSYTATPKSGMISNFPASLSRRS